MEFKLCPTARGHPRRFPPPHCPHSEVVIDAAQSRKFPALTLTGNECITIL